MSFTYDYDSNLLRPYWNSSGAGFVSSGGPQGGNSWTKRIYCKDREGMYFQLRLIRTPQALIQVHMSHLGYDDDANSYRADFSFYAEHNDCFKIEKGWDYFDILIAVPCSAFCDVTCETDKSGGKAGWTNFNFKDLESNISSWYSRDIYNEMAFIPNKDCSINIPVVLMAKKIIFNQAGTTAKIIFDFWQFHSKAQHTLVIDYSGTATGQVIRNVFSPSSSYVSLISTDDNSNTGWQSDKRFPKSLMVVEKTEGSTSFTHSYGNNNPVTFVISKESFLMANGATAGTIFTPYHGGMLVPMEYQTATVAMSAVPLNLTLIAR